MVAAASQRQGSHIPLWLSLGPRSAFPLDAAHVGRSVTERVLRSERTDDALYEAKHLGRNRVASSIVHDEPILAV